ncbi:hypothetical protein RIF29_05131 [Crotalaria pallida]|uniref:Uncharacterized protein n=1 Tax=Crotalaria pallida TaxID=3830 RepID=A0AAN9J2Q5_CROPI
MNGPAPFDAVAKRWNRIFDHRSPRPWVGGGLSPCSSPIIADETKRKRDTVYGASMMPQGLLELNRKHCCVMPTLRWLKKKWGHALVKHGHLRKRRAGRQAT